VAKAIPLLLSPPQSITAALLAWKQPITGFATGLSDIELRSAVLLAILSFIVYPVLPAHPVGPYGLIQPQETWATVLLIAALGFVNYVLWKIYGPRSIDITSFLGGLVNSTAAVAELSSRVARLVRALSSWRIAEWCWRQARCFCVIL
jgi:uncharacterized membrane protein (DUF4010 family)